MTGTNLLRGYPPNRKIKRVYIASPLFNPKEREENKEIAVVLQNFGYSTFLPQEDGLLFEDIVKEMEKTGVQTPQAELIVTKLIAYLDVYQVADSCQATVLNMNGRVPDEGGLIEGAITFANGKPLVLYKSDSRSLIRGYDNPLISVMTGFKIVDDIQDIPPALMDLEKATESEYAKVLRIAREIFGDKKSFDIKELVELGKKYFS